MSTVTSHVPGSFCWIELGTTDADAARSFYTRLFGWTFNEFDVGEMGKYSIFQHGGRDVAAVYRNPDASMPVFWLSYIAVSDADAIVEQAKGRGAKVVSGPFDVGGNGRMAVLADPLGAAIAVWQANNHHGIGVRDEAGSLCWNELQATDTATAKEFYAPLFGWRMKESEEYTEWHLGEQAVGGMLPFQPPGVPPFWLAYFAVEDCEAAVAKAKSLGATELAAPMDIPNVGRFAVLADPQGAAFAVIKLMM